MNDDTLLVPLDREKVKTQIYEIRGHQVMIDHDIAVYFGVETKALNKSMKRNEIRFPPEFCFQLTREECSRFQIGTLNEGRGSNLKYLPYVYTEQGVAMLTSVLHSERAVRASIQIMQAFVEMSHMLREKPLVEQRLLQLANRTEENTAAIERIESSMITKDELSPFLQLFEKDRKQEEILILNGEPYKADLAYQKILSETKKELVMVDDYISSKTLKHLLHCPGNVNITLISDNKGRSPLQFYEYTDFLKEYPALSGRITLLQSHHKVHDRYLFLDPSDPDGKIYHCGASSKDAGEKITMIMECKDTSHFQTVLGKLLKGKVLVLT